MEKKIRDTQDFILPDYVRSPTQKPHSQCCCWRKFYCLRCCRGFMKKSGLDNHEIDCSKFMPQRVLMPQDVKQREPLPGRKPKGEGKS